MEKRVIGYRKPRDLGEFGPPTDQEQAWLSSFAHRRTRVPKGVFRYRTHEEANADWDRWNAEGVAEISMKQDLLKLLQQTLRGELNRTRRRKNRSPWVIGGLTVAIVAISYVLHEPKIPSSTLGRGTELVCGVKSVYDGDTLTASCPDGEVKVRVFGIDAPEMGQEPWGDRSREAFRGLLPRRDSVRLRVIDQDRYGRVVAQVFVGERDAGLEMVRQGRAVVYEQYNNSAVYRQAQAEAQQARRGIWEKPGGQQDPAAWRRLNPR